MSLPDADDRYYLFPMLDGWTDVFQVPGKRTTGTGPQKYAITGPGWKGTLPDGVKEYKSPTSMVWLLGRIYCTGTPEDYAAVHKMQDAVSIVPLSSYGKPYTPPPGKVDPSIDMKTPVRDQVNALSSAAYFNLLATLMETRTAIEGLFNPGQCLQREYLAPLLRPHRDTIGNGMPQQLIHWIFI